MKQLIKTTMLGFLIYSIPQSNVAAYQGEKEGLETDDRKLTVYHISQNGNQTETGTSYKDWGLPNNQKYSPA